MIEPTDGFALFVQIVESGSVSAAARELQMPRATLSRRLSALEERLGVRLVHRSTRRLGLTSAGEELYRRAVVVVRQAEEALEAVGRLDGVPRGVLRVSAPPAVGADPFGNLFRDFLRLSPEVSLEVSTSTRHVDLIAEGVDVAVRAGIVRDEGLISRVIARTDVGAYGSPELIARHGGLDTLAAAERAPWIARLDPMTSRKVSAVPLRGGGQIEVSGRLATNDMWIAVAAAAGGMGLAVLPGAIAADGVAAGRLVRVLPETIGWSGVVAVVYPDRERLDPKVRAFVDFVAKRAADLIPPTVQRGLGATAESA